MLYNLKIHPAKLDKTLIRVVANELCLIQIKAPFEGIISFDKFISMNAKLALLILNMG